MSKCSLSRVSSGIAATLLWIASFGMANAILVRGSIDPIFGGSGTLAGIYWTADVTFNVDGSCLSTIASSISMTGSCTISGLTATGTVNDSVDPTINVNYLATPSFSPTSLDLAVDSSLNVVGIGSSPIGFGTVSLPGLTPNYNTTANLWVQFFMPTETLASQADLIATLCQTLTQGPRDYFDSHTIASNDSVCDQVSACPGTDPTSGTKSVRGDVAITQAPEPGSLALVLAAMLVCWPLLRRRQSR